MSASFAETKDAVDWLCRELGPDLRVATPLGLGKPNVLLNALYARAKSDPALKLTLFTALSLDPPDPGAGLKRRFFAPFAERQWGKDYPVLAYARDARAERLPKNVRVHEFYAQAGAYLHAPRMQRDHVNVNYTHVAEAILQMDVQVVLQLVARRGERYSLSSNPDLTLDLVALYERAGKRLRVIGVVHPEMPFMGGDAEVGAEFFDGLALSPPHALFALPRTPIDVVDHAIGMHASTRIEDGGTLQVGIGSLSDAVVAALILRHSRPELYQRVSGTALGPFSEGLYGLSEMVTDGFMHLRRAGILRREVKDAGASTFLHGAFFLGSKEFYAWLRDMPEAEARGVRMSRVSKVNDLYDPDELLLRRQRVKARFLNTCMQATLLGGAASDTLADGRVVSGVGGQYNFVAMAHELPGARSVLMLRSTRDVRGKRSSNIVWSQGHLTVPRHLRDTVVTEYGVADLRNKTDEQCIAAMLEIADAEFQEGLAAEAKKHGKLGAWRPRPENTPQRLLARAKTLREDGLFAPFPFGSDFSAEEERLALALAHLQTLRKPQLLLAAARGARRDAARFQPELARVSLDKARSFEERLSRFALLDALWQSDQAP